MSLTVSAALDITELTLEPGTPGSATVTVYNTGPQVEAFVLRVVGEPAGWATVAPEELHIYPGDQQQAQVSFAPPRSPDVLAGPRPFGVQVAVADRPDDSVVPEGQVTVLPYADLSIELTPRTSHGRGRVRHELAIDNRGNAPVPVAVAGGDVDEAVTVRPSPAELVVGPGEAAFTKIRVRPTRRRWTGQPVTHPFRVEAHRPDAPPVAADGAMLQVPTLPRWLGKAVAATLALALIAALSWVALLRPVVRSAAQAAVAVPVAAAAAQAKQANQNSGEATKVAGEANKTAAKAGAEAGKAQAGTAGLGKTLIDKGVLKPGDVAAAGVDPKAAGQGPATTVADPTAAVPFSQRLSAQTPGNATRTEDFTVPAKQVRSITDLFYENPQGDTGTVTVKANDQVLFTKSLANFRDLADHFVTPITLGAGQTLTLEVSCTKAGEGAPGNQCRTALVLVGTTATQPAN